MANLAFSIADKPVAQAELAPPPASLDAVIWHTMEQPAAITAWDLLAQRASEPNPFYESWHLLPSLRALDPKGKVRLLRLEAGGRLTGLMPVRADSGYYGYPAPNLRNWAHANCFLGAPLVESGYEEQFWRSLLSWADNAPGKALFLHLAPLALAGPLYEALRRVLSETDRPAVLVHREERAMLQSALSPDAYFDAAVNAKKRKELRRQSRRLAEEGALAIERETGADGIDGWTDEFLRLEASGWKGRVGSALAADSATASLFTEAIRGAASADKLERLALTLDGRRVAMLATFLSRPGAYSYKTAYAEELARFSPGVLLQRENLQFLARDGIDWCDSCASADHPMIDHLWRERRAIGRYSIVIGGAARRAAFRLLSLAENRGKEPLQP